MPVAPVTLVGPEDAAISEGAPPRRAIVRSLVALCAHLTRPAGAIEPARLRSRLEPRFGIGSVQVEVVPGLCDRAEALVEPVRRARARACILALCDGRAPLPEYRAWAARAGLDPFRIDAVPLGLVSVGGADEQLTRLTTQIAACATRLSVPATGGRARRFLPWPARLSRRALFTVPARPISPAASISAERCSAPRCSICLLVCPTGAIQADERGRMSVAADRCDGCGVCVSACPSDAFDLPGSTIGEHEVFLEELLRPSPGSDADAPAGIVFACAPDADRGGGSGTPDARFEADWSVATVPCVSMVTPGWILQAIAAGVPVVALAPCRDPAPLPQGISLLERVEWCRNLLATVGITDPEHRVRLLPAEPGVATNLGADLPATLTALPAGRDGDHPRRLTLREPTATVEALDRLAPAPGPDLVIFGQASPLGRVRLLESSCTSCGACVLVCPTGALAFARQADGWVLSLDPGRCVPDGYCAAVCPENALQVEPAVDLTGLRRGRQVLKQGAALACSRCGAPCSEPMLVDRVRRLLPSGLGSFLDDASTLCAECAAGQMSEYAVAGATVSARSDGTGIVATLTGLADQVPAP